MCAATPPEARAAGSVAGSATCAPNAATRTSSMTVPAMRAWRTSAENEQPRQYH